MIEISEACFYDFESISTLPTGTVIDLAMLYVNFEDEGPWDFDALRRRTVYAKFDANEQIKTFGRHKCPETLEWWKKQEPAAKAILRPDPERDVSIRVLPDLIHMYLVEQGASDKTVFFTRGHMDPAMMDHIIRYNCEQPMPYPYYAVHNIRTFIWGLTGVRKSNILLPEDWLPQDFTPHSSVDDVVADALRIKWLLEQLN